MKRLWLSADYNQAESRVVAWKGPVPKLKAWYIEGVDVHAYVCRMIAEVVQRGNVATPINQVTGKPLFKAKHWSEYAKGDEERELSKRTVHAYNYGIGDEKFSIITKIDLALARMLLKIYGALFPEIKTNYHAWVEACLRKTRTIWMPEPVKFRKVFWDKLDDATMRSAYSCFPQCTVGSMLNRTLVWCCTIFKRDLEEQLKDQWHAWYGAEHWDQWRRLRDYGLQSPQALLWGGMDIRMNVHDAGIISIPDDDNLVAWAARQWRERAEEPIYINPNDRDDFLSIPVDFKIGPNLGDLHDYKLEGR